MSNAVADDFGIGFDVQFFKNAAAIRADSLNTQVKFLCDLGHGFPGRHHTGKLIFSVR